MNTEIQILPLRFEEACHYVTDQLSNGLSLAQALLKKLDFKKGHFFALLNSLGDKAKIHEFQVGGILPANPLEQLSFEGKIYSGRRKADSIPQLTLYLESMQGARECCFFEDVVHNKSDPISSDIEKYRICFQEEVYFYMKKEEFIQGTVEKIIHHTDAQWYYMNIISRENPPEALENLTEEKLEKIAQGTRYLVLGAYDMEGFVVWDSVHMFH